MHAKRALSVWAPALSQSTASQGRRRAGTSLQEFNHFSLFPVTSVSASGSRWLLHALPAERSFVSKPVVAASFQRPLLCSHRRVYLLPQLVY